ncbi:hypothetical protein NIES4101_43460 [Calothrix sp. NIES-4101]|nr:hypothetical protein NIES4101_43460 [Calothrix sp. NIES-4101]
MLLNNQDSFTLKTTNIYNFYSEKSYDKRSKIFLVEFKKRYDTNFFRNIKFN